MATRQFPGFDHIFKVSEAQDPDALVVGLAQHHEDPRRLLRGEIPGAPLRLRQLEGRQARDLVEGSATGIKLISPALQAVLTAKAITGWSTYPVVIETDRITSSTEGYAGLGVLGRSGPILYDKARIEDRANAVGRAYKARIGLYFDPASWDGSDLFMPDDDTALLLATARFRATVTEARLTNITFTPASAYELVWVPAPR